MKKILSHSHISYEKAVFYALVALIVAAALLYSYLINQTVLNVVARNNAEKEIAELSSDVGDLEMRYLARKNEITREYAHRFGFYDEDDVKYVYRSGPARALTLLDDRAQQTLTGE